MNPKKLNAALLEKVAHHIEEEPKRFNMNTWFERSRKSPCGTVACVGGWINLLSLPSRKLNVALKASDEEQWKVVCRALGRDPDDDSDDSMGTLAEKAIGVPRGWGDSNLFYDSVWPEPFKSAFRLAEAEHDTTALAMITAARIRYLIATGK